MTGLQKPDVLKGKNSYPRSNILGNTLLGWSKHWWWANLCARYADIWSWDPVGRDHLWTLAYMKALLDWAISHIAGHRNQLMLSNW
jgi:hypothetical protein